MAWDASVTAQSLQLLAAAAMALASDRRGYVAAAEGGEVLVSFDNTVGGNPNIKASAIESQSDLGINHFASACLPACLHVKQAFMGGRYA
jgi:hypothetical protein